MGAMVEAQRFAGDEFALSSPCERVVGELLGWGPANDATLDGRLPWVAKWAAQDGLELDQEKTWGLISPGHWMMGREHVTLLDPAELGLSESDAREAFNAISPLFHEDGWDLVWGTPTRWYASHPSLEGLPTASLDRVVGRNPDVWLNDHPQARRIRRIQAEVQMMLYQHPLHERRTEQGLPPLNSFWLSGCGRVDVNVSLPANCVLVDALQSPLQADDMDR